MTISVILMLLGLLGLGLVLRQSDISSAVITLRVTSLSPPTPPPPPSLIPWCDYRCLFVTQVCGSLSVIVCTLGYLLWLLRFV